MKNGVSGRDPAVHGFWKLSFPENEGAVKGNFPVRAFMPVRGVLRTSWVWDSVIFFSGLWYEWPRGFNRVLKNRASCRDPALCGFCKCSHIDEYAALSKTPHALADGPMLAFQHP
ncbi:MAG: hypothetical protein Q7U75_05610 [Desulfobacterales bacterium]|nr:hypothetical protein [Desulfobacterales bacterium]